MNGASSAVPHRVVDHALASFLCACELDVAVRKPGNVSHVSAGHGMQAEMFRASAQAAARPLFQPGARVGQRIESAVAASWDAAGCNTNLGIVLLCAPIALAAEQCPGGERTNIASLRIALDAVLADLDVDDTRAAYRAIARARPGGLGSAPAEDVHDAPTLGLRDVMALAAERDSIARQYRDGYAELFELGLTAALAAGQLPRGATCAGPEAALVALVQRVYLNILSAIPDTHIVRKHGEALAHTVMRSAQAWQARERAGAVLDADPGFAAWDLDLKAKRINPGTSADLTVATLFVAGLAEAATKPG